MMTRTAIPASVVDRRLLGSLGRLVNSKERRNLLFQTGNRGHRSNYINIKMHHFKGKWTS